MNRNRLFIIGLALLIGIGLCLVLTGKEENGDADWVASQQDADGPAERDDLRELPSMLGNRCGIARTNFIPTHLEPAEERDAPELTFEQRRLKRRMEKEGFRRMMNGAVMPLRDPGAGAKEGK